jgi:hypothetical protein
MLASPRLYLDILFQMYGHCQPFHPCLIFASKARSRSLPLDWSLVKSSNRAGSSLAWTKVRSFVVSNTLLYDTDLFIVMAKSFVVQARKVFVIRSAWPIIIWRGVRYLTGENLRVVWVEYSTLNKFCFISTWVHYNSRTEEPSTKRNSTYWSCSQTLNLVDVC